MTMSFSADRVFLNTPVKEEISVFWNDIDIGEGETGNLHMRITKKGMTATLILKNDETIEEHAFLTELIDQLLGK